MAESSKYVSILTPERVRYYKQSRFNPIRNLTADNLARQIEEFNAGYLRQYAQSMEALQRRDDVLQCVIPKRIASITKHKWEILTDPNADEAEADAHKQKLEYFYRNLRATDAIDRNQNRGVSLLIEQMMDAVAKKYASHEIIWKPSPKGLTAMMNFVPLWFFENKTGKLRFLKNDGDVEGIELDPDGWMVTCGPGLMEPCSVAWMYKNLCLKDWLIYCEKHGMPGVVGKTKHALDTPGWQAVETAVAAVAADFSCVISFDDELDKIDFTAQGQLPYQPLAERMDRALASLWRGADLSTISSGGSGEGNGASLQGEESHALEEQDARLISETCNEQLDRKVLAYYFGEDVEPLAYFQIVVPPRQNVDTEIKVDEFLVKNGVRLSRKDTAERYGREEAEEGDEVLETQMPAPGEGMGGPGAPGGRGQISFANEVRAERQLLKTSMVEAAAAQDDVMAPVRERIQAAVDMPNEAAFKVALSRLRDDLPKLLHQINRNPAGEKAIARAMTAGLFNGLLTGTVHRHSAGSRRRREIVHVGSRVRVARN